jgi:hypothetical protein
MPSLLVRALKVGHLFRYGRVKDPGRDSVDELPNYYHGTHTPGHKLPLLEAGINPIGMTTGRLPWRPAVLISSSPHKIGSHENPWQDVFEPDHGHIRFYGDNKSPNKAADASFGNRVLPQKFRAPRTRTTAGRRHRWSSFGE